MDDLVTDLQNEWSQHKKKCDEPLKPTVSSTSGAKDFGNEFFEVQLSQILQPVQPSTGATRVSLDKEQPNHESLVKACTKQGPWSINWIENQKRISEGGVVFSSNRKSDTRVKNSLTSKTCPCTSPSKPSAIKKGGVIL